jgi:hypothetical protein
MTEFKVTDRRMFTEDGQLREEYRFLESAESTPETAPSAAAEQASPRAASPAGSILEEAAPKAASAPPADVPGMPPSELGLLDLVGMLAESVALYLGEVRLPDGRTAQDLRQARAYIDLLAVLEEKTRGNRTPEEDAVLGDLLYRLRIHYVQKQAKPS